MNIYLDIDGVLLANENQAANGADDFLKAVLEQHPDSTYWLTTHCWQDKNQAKEILTPHLQPKTVLLLDRIKPTEWGELKTDAIDFTQSFLWFDDDLFDEERNVLVAHDALEGYVRVDLAEDENFLYRIMQNLL